MGPSEFDSSDEEPTEVEVTQFEVSWLSLEPVQYAVILGISPLPGCKFKDIRRNLLQNIEEIRELGIQDVFVFCTLAELKMYRVPTLLQEYSKQDVVVHHYPFLDGNVPQMDECLRVLEDLKTCMDNSRRTLIHCYGGLGRSCLIAACLLMHLNESVTSQEAISLVRAVRGPGAIQTIKQYNFINEFRENVTTCPSSSDENNRALSR
ncbi:cyclin-dependent kinase inhibitor 3 [Hyperolius riggenbachi]|uniref:cyclin-dependent kinase inhibitor 3 n=1 Tax=Hyperolius riggenbachi TaxID=752182 RepID=UPI0035A2A8B8